VTQRLRPGLHYAPVREGVIFISARRSFVLAGPQTLLALLDRVVPMLEEGTDVPTIVAALGREDLGPVLERILGSLERHGLLLDESRLTAPAPSDAERSRFAGAIAHLETYADDPYAALQRLRRARAVVRGAGSQAASAGEALVNSGFGGVAVHHPPGAQPDPLGATEVPNPRAVDDVDGNQLEIAVVPTVDGAGARAPICVPVRWAGAVLLCGPVLESDDDRSRHAALLDRVAGWAEREPFGGASLPLGTMLGAAYAAHAAFERVALGPRAPVAHVVHSALEADEVALDSPAAAPPKEASSSAADAHIAYATEAVSAAAPLLARWSGFARWDMPSDLAQIPVSVTVVVGREAFVPDRVMGWGATQAHASLDAILGLLRCAVAAEDGPGVAAAGREEADGLLDGVLRLLPRELGERKPLDPSALDVEGRRRWRTLTESEGVDASLVLARLPGSELVLVEVCTAGGRPIAAQWGLGGAGAAASALGAAIAGRRANAAGGGPCANSDPTSALLVESPERNEPMNEAQRWLDAHGHSVQIRRRAPDAVLGSLPLWSGRVWLA
jgi:hypothetical protein